MTHPVWLRRWWRGAGLFALVWGGALSPAAGLAGPSDVAGAAGLPAELSAELMAYLTAFDSNPSAAELRAALGADAAAQLVAAARRATLSDYARSRALSLLHDFPGETVEPLLVELASDAAVPDAIRARAVYTWVRHPSFRPASAADAWGICAALLQSADAQARKTTALAVGWLPGSDSERAIWRDALAQRRDVEADRVIRAYFDKSLGRLATPPAPEVAR